MAVKICNSRENIDSSEWKKNDYYIQAEPEIRKKEWLGYKLYIKVKTTGFTLQTYMIQFDHLINNKNIPEKAVNIVNCSVCKK